MENENIEDIKNVENEISAIEEQVEKIEDENSQANSSAKVEPEKKEKKKSKKKKTGLKILVLGGVYFVVFFALLILTSIEKPAPDKVYENLGELYLAEKKYNQAIEYYDEQTKIKPDSPQNYYKLGLIYKILEQHDEAINHFKKAYKLNPSNQVIIRELADIYIDVNDFKTAAKLMKKITDNSKKSQKLKGTFYYKFSFHFEDVNLRIFYLKKSYNFLRNSNSDELKATLVAIEDAYFEKADVLFQEGKIEEAIYTVTTILKYSKSAKVYNKLAILYTGVDSSRVYKNIRYSLRVDKSYENKKECSDILVQMGNYFEKNDNKERAELIYIKAANLIKDNSVENSVNKTIISLGIEKVYFERRIPQVIFKINNLGRDDINFLKAKIVFEIEEVGVFEEGEQVIVTAKNPLKKGKTMNNIHFSATKPLNDYINIKKCSVKIYLAETDGKWRHYKTEKIEY